MINGSDDKLQADTISALKQALNGFKTSLITQKNHPTLMKSNDFVL